jgi:RNA polymerase sigma-70 factor (ECF subfamily)
MKQLAAFRGESSFRGFAMLIVSRTATAVRRKRRRGLELTEKLRASEARDDAELPLDPAEPADQGLRRVLTELLATLPDVQAETFLLRVVLEYDVAEVAAETGAAVNTVRSRLRLAREALRRRIDADPRLAELGIHERALATTSNGRADDE